MTRNLFFFGTLRHLALLELVLGRTAKDLDIKDAALPGYAVFAVAEGVFPTIKETDGGRALGILLRGLSPEDIARLDFYEGSFAYDLQPVVLSNGIAAEVYLPKPGRWTAEGVWSLEDWVQNHGAQNLIAAQEIMGYFGKRHPDEIAAMESVIHARAASTLRAQRSVHGSDTFHGKIDVLKQTRSYSDFFALDDVQLRHEQYDGTMSPALDRAVFIAVDAALVLPYDPVRDCVMVVEQVRLGPVVRGDKTCWQVEPIAGRIDAGEAPETAARREAQEEAGLDIGALEPIAEMYPSPGNSTEFYYVYLAIADLPDQAQGPGGLEDEGEDIRSHIWSFADLMDRVARKEVANAPLVTCAYYLAHHRDRLRSAGADATP